MKRRPRTVLPTPTPLRTLHVFLDTQVYRRFGHNPESPPLVALRDHLDAGRLVLHTTDVTLAEVRRQLVEYVGETSTELRFLRVLSAS